MQHLFVEYPLAIKLKEAGFDLETPAMYYEGRLYPVADRLALLLDNDHVFTEEFPGYATKDIVFIPRYAFYENNVIIRAPIYQQVFDWLEGMGFAIQNMTFSDASVIIVRHKKEKEAVFVGKIAHTSEYSKQRKQTWDQAIEEAMKVLKEKDGKLTSFEEMEEKYYGKPGTETREAYEQRFLDEMELLSPPGDTIAETLEAKKISLPSFAILMARLKISVNDLLSGKQPITDQIADELERVLDIPAQFWLNREKLYREKLQAIQQQENRDK